MQKFIVLYLSQLIIDRLLDRLVAINAPEDVIRLAIAYSWCFEVARTGEAVDWESWLPSAIDSL